MKEKKKVLNKIFKRIFLAILIAFTAIYISQATGYYEYEQHKSIVLTNEQIKKFESDIKDGKDVDALSYLKEEEKDYSSKISNPTKALYFPLLLNLPLYIPIITFFALYPMS